MANPVAIIPSNAQISLFSGCGWQQKFSPIDPTTGALKDFTSFVGGSAQLIISGGTRKTPLSIYGGNLVVVQGDATGLTLSQSSTAIDAIIAAVGDNAAYYTLAAVDATNTNRAVVATGQLAIQQNPSGY